MQQADETELEERPTNTGNGPVYLPTPEEIKAECERIRSEWSDDRRANLSPIGDTGSNDA